MDNLDFLNSYWKRLNSIEDHIRNNLSSIETPSFIKKEGEFLKTISYSMLKDWNINLLNHSKNLKALTNKLSHMIFTEKATSITPLLKRIIYKGVKKQRQPDSIGYGTQKIKFHIFLGYGHFRWNYKAYVLTHAEIMRLKKFFNL